MALVDELRYRKMEVLEHLDLPQREAEVAERIRAYYRNQGIECDDETVAQGVRAFFERRLVFEARPMSLWEKFAARMIASSAFRIWTIVILVFVILFGSSFWTGFKRGFVKAFNESRGAHMSQGSAATSTTPATAPAAPASPIRQEQPVPVEPVPLEKDAQPVADGTHVTESLMRFEQLRKRFLAIPINAEDHQSMLGRMSIAAVSASLGGPFADEALNVFEAELDFLESNLTLEVANLPGLPSGIELNKKDGSGKAWFIFVQPFDEQHRPKLYLTRESADANAPVVARRVLGVEVSQAEYQRIKQDKLDNGLIDDPVLGTSPAGNYRRLYNQRVLPSPGFFPEKSLEKADIPDMF